MGFLTKTAWGVIIFGIMTAVALNILASLGTTLTGASALAVRNLTAALNTNVVGNFGLILLIVVMVFIIALVMMLQGSAAQGEGGGSGI